MPAQRRYSSIIGCCICGANTSAQPFAQVDKITPNKKSLTEVLLKCFQLEQERTGEICDSCLSIARKWLKTSRSKRNSINFKKVVDSKRRFKPRTTRRSSQSTEMPAEIKYSNTKEKEKPASKHVSPKPVTPESIKTKPESNQKEDIHPMIEDRLSEDEIEEVMNEDDDSVIDELSENPPLAFDSPCFSPDIPDKDKQILGKKETVETGTQTAFLFPALTSPQANANKLPFIDLSKWRQEEICCGTIFRGPNGEVLVDPKWLRPFCEMCNRSTQPPTPVEKGDSQEINIFDNKLASLCS